MIPRERRAPKPGKEASPRSRQAAGTGKALDTWAQFRCTGELYGGRYRAFRRVAREYPCATRYAVVVNSFFVRLVAFIAVLGAATRVSYAQEAESEGRARAAAFYSGPRLGIAPGVLLSPSGVAFGIGGAFNYGVDTGSVIVAPGATAGITFFPDGGRMLSFVPEVRLAYPIEWFVPFIDGGLGPAHYSGDKVRALARFGGGFTIHPGPSNGFALGLGVSYVTLLGTDVRGLSIAPVLALAF
jgi:opacity protein-like surface antigen